MAFPNVSDLKALSDAPQTSARKEFGRRPHRINLRQKSSTGRERTENLGPLVGKRVRIVTGYCLLFQCHNKTDRKE